MADKIYIAEFDAENRLYLNKLADAEKKTIQSMNKMHSAITGLGKTMLGAFGATQIISFLNQSIQAYKEEEQAIRKLDVALGRNTAGLQRYAGQLQKLTTFGDENILNAMALIGMFVKEENQIKRLTQATLDFAAAKDVDLASAADLITKTFASSTNALKRYGIDIEGAAGSSERFNSLLQAMAHYQGQAEERAKTLSGEMEQLNNQISDQQEKLGKNLLPLWNLFLQGTNIFVETIAEAINAIFDDAEVRLRDFGRDLRGFHKGSNVFWFQQVPFLPDGGLPQPVQRMAWLKEQQERLKDINETISEGNLTQSEYNKLLLERSRIQDLLNPKIKKQVEDQEQLKNQLDLMEEIYQRMREMDDEDAILPDVAIGSGDPTKALWGKGNGVTNNMMIAWEKFRDGGEDSKDTMTALVSLSNQMASNFNFAGHTFVGQLSQALAMIDSISNIILTIASMFGGGGGFGLGGLLSMIGLEKGGRIAGGKVGKIPSFASGGSFSTPAYGGAYPFLAHRNETIDVYNAGQTSRMEKKLDGIREAVMAGTLAATRKGGGGGSPIIIKLGEKVIAEAVQKELNKMERFGVNIGQL